MLNDFILVFVLYEKDGKVLEFFIGVLLMQKNYLKCLISHRNQKQIFHQLVMVSFYYRVNVLIKTNKFTGHIKNVVLLNFKNFRGAFCRFVYFIIVTFNLIIFIKIFYQFSSLF